MNIRKLLRELIIPAIGGVGMFLLLRYLLTEKEETTEPQKKSLPAAKQQQAGKRQRPLILTILIIASLSGATFFIGRATAPQQEYPAQQHAK